MFRKPTSPGPSQRSNQKRAESPAAQKSVSGRALPLTLSPTMKSVKFKKLASNAKLTNAVKRTKKQTNFDRPLPSTVFGKLKANFDEDTQETNSKLKALEPTIKSLALKIPKFLPQIPQHQTHARTELSENVNPQLPSALMSALGEKLITVGGYIVSLQPVRDDIVTTVKPRISTDREGFEAEIKIIGCHPTDIRYEKRYDTLIVIGVVPKVADTSKSVYLGEGVAVQGRDYLRSRGLLASKHVSIARPTSEFSSAPAGVVEDLDEIQEVVNIFAPKDISVNQVLITKPDAMGRIIVRGP